MKRRIFSLPTIALLLLTVFAAVPVSAKDTWTRVQSKNFLLIGNASEKDIQKVAVKLEQFRDVFTRLFSKVQFTSPVPTTVIVFKSDSSYRPFKRGSAIGYFLPGTDVNYITLTSERRGQDDDPFNVIFHEYVHLLVNNTMGDVPVWFNEGLAEYYSTLEIDDERKVYLGNLISNHVLFLRQQGMIPLKALLTVDHRSPYYNESLKKGVFYAQSWAFVHYLLQGNEGKRVPQMGKFISLMTAGTPVEEAFKNAFQMDFATMEKELKAYVQGSNYKRTRATFERKLEFDAEIQAAPISEAEAQSYLGDLLLHMGALTEAEKRLQQAVELDSSLAMANSSLGMVKLRQGKFAEAKQLLQKAVAANSQNHLAHYYYAFVLSREGMDASDRISAYSPEAAETMRAELKKAIELAPTFPESYSLLAFINLVRGDSFDESIALLKRAQALAPARHDFSFMLAQIYLRKEDFKSSRQVLETLMRSSTTDAQLQANAQSLLNVITNMEEQKARYKELSEGRSREGGAQQPPPPPRLTRRGDPSGTSPPSELEEMEIQFPLREPKEGEARVQGLLTRVDCDAKGLTFTIKVNERLLKLRTSDINSIQFVTYTPDVSGEMTCGERKPVNHVVVVYRLLKEARTKFDGELLSVEFVPKDFELKK